MRQLAQRPCRCQPHAGGVRHIAVSLDNQSLSPLHLLLLLLL
jgi:hypothetical protein